MALSTQSLRDLYLPPANEFTRVTVPALPFIMIDGDGAPQSATHLRAVDWLLATAKPIRRLAKERMGKDFAEPPVEALCKSGDKISPSAGSKDQWAWRMMIPAPDWLDESTFSSAVAEAGTELGDVPQSLRFETFEEGPCVQVMHAGPYDQIPATLQKLYTEYLPANRLTPRDYYHEIYLTDPKTTPAANLRTVLRQPVA